MNFPKAVLLILLILPLNLASQIMPDALNTEVERVGEFKSSKLDNFTVPSFLLAASFIAIPFSNDFYSLRNEYAPNFSYSYDDYLQYLPAAAMLGQKLGGVKSRSSWGKMLVADAFSIALMVGVVNSVKYIAKVKRPDSNEHNSFPSRGRI